MKRYTISVIILLIFSNISIIGLSINVNESIVKNPNISDSGLLDSAWPMSSHDNRHTGLSPYDTSDNAGDEMWRFFCDSVDSGMVIDDEGCIYFGDQGYDFYKIDSSGGLIWKTHLDGSVWGSTPALSDDGIVYVCTWSSMLYALDRDDGFITWVFDANNIIACSPAIADDGTIYFGTMGGGDNHGKVFAINPDGTMKWVYKTGGVITGDPAIGEDGTVYIGAQDDYLYAFNPDGSLKWRFATNGHVDGGASIGEDGTVYIGSWGTTHGGLYALFPDGSLKWYTRTLFGFNHNPAVGPDGTIYCGCTIIFAINPDGSVKWTYELGDYSYHRYVDKSSPCVSANGVIYFGIEIGENNGGEILALNSDGSLRWCKNIANQWVWSSPCIGEDGTVYIGSFSSKWDHRGSWMPVGYIHAFNTVDTSVNSAPGKPSILSEPVRWYSKLIYIGFQSIDPENHPVEYFVEWGDGTTTSWMAGRYEEDIAASGEAVYLEHRYWLPKKYTIRAKARDIYGLESDWSTFQVIAPKNNFNSNSDFNIFNIISYLKEYLTKK